MTFSQLIAAARGACFAPRASAQIAPCPPPVEHLESRTLLSSSYNLQAAPSDQILGAGPLVPTIVKSTLPTTDTTAAPLHGIITVELTNTTAATVKGKFDIAIKLSDGQYNFADPSLKNTLKTIAVKTTASLALPINVPRGGIAAGSYTLLAEVTDPSQDVQVSPTGPTLTVAGASVSLSTTLVKSSIPAPVIAGTTSNASFTLRFTNTGNTTILPGGKTSPFVVNLDASNFNPSNGPIVGGATIGLFSKSNLKLAPDKSFVVKIGLERFGKRLLPIDPVLGGGTYSLLVVANATNFAIDQQQPLSIPLTIVAPTELLSPVIAKDTVPASLAAGKKAHGTVVLRITNNGNIISTAINSQGDVTNNGRTTVELLATPTDGSTAIPISAAISRPLRIRPGKAAQMAIPVNKLLANLSAGTYTITALVTDPNGNTTTASSESITVA